MSHIPQGILTVLRTVLFLSFVLWCTERGFLKAYAAPLKCPDGAKLTGSEPPGGTEQGCKREDKDGNLIPHGPWIEWYVNGAKHKEGRYLNGKRVGLWTWWYPNGTKMQEGQFRNDTPIVGTWTQWSEDGKNLTKPEEGQEERPSSLSGFFEGLKKKFK